MILGLEAIVVAIVIWLAGPLVARRIPGSGRVANLVAVVLLVVGAATLGLAIVNEQTPQTGLQNPVPRTPESVAAGRSLYLANCASCHGIDLRGGGPLAGTTAIPPPSLISGHIDAHTDGDVFYWISEGLPGGMPAWKGRLSEREIWDLVNFLREMNEQQ